ncbi:MAG: NADH-quinone oxidoreductase subunit L, partial [Candidatus Rokuibacteriota bacterium]
VVAGWAVGVPSAHGTRFERFLAPVFPLHEGAPGGVAGILLLLLSVVVALAGILLAWFMYVSTPVRPARIGVARTPVHALLLHAWYVDWLYDRAIVRPLLALSCVLAERFDLGVIDGVVNGLGRGVVRAAAGLRTLQTGYVVNYALTMLAGAVVVLGFFLVR